MRRSKLVACIAGLIALHCPPAAFAQDEDQSEEEQPAPVEDQADEEPPAPDGEGEDAAPADPDAGADGEPDGDQPDGQPADDGTDAADTFEEDDEPSDGAFVYPADDPTDLLYADDTFNDPEADDPADDAIGVETGTDPIPDVYELFDEDGDPSSEDDDEGIDDVFEQAGLFHDRLPVIRKPPPLASGPIALEAPNAPPFETRVQSGPSTHLGRKWFAQAPRLDAGSAALHRAPAPPRASSAALRLITSVSAPIGLRPGASAVYMVRNNGAPFQAAIRHAVSPRKWLSTEALAPYRNTPEWELKHVCGGTLVAPNWVLTAAHCFGNTREKPAALVKRGLSVLLGAEDISDPDSGSDYRVDRMVIHDGWNPRNIYRNDIALLHIVQKSSSSRVNLISSITRYTGPEPAGPAPVSVMGWGRSIDNGTQLATAALWRADVRLIQVANCLNKPGMGKVKPAWAPAPFDKVDRTTVCAGESRAKACSGDSGGPLFFTNGTAMLVGVVSWTGRDSCGKPEIPNVYSSVSAFETWIKRAMATRPDPQSTVQRVP